MNWFRLVGVRVVVLVWLAAGAGRTIAAEEDEKPDGVGNKIKLDSANKPRTDEPEPILIPLDQIWALNMPGTHRIITGKHSDDSKYAAEEGPVMHEIFTMMASEGETKNSRAAFAVPGTNLAALRNACKTLRGQGMHRQPLSSNNEVSLFFLTGKCHNYLHLHDVTRRRKRIVIRYQFVGHVDAGLHMNLAVIPLGKLPVGQYQVEFEQIPMDENYREWNKIPSVDELTHIVAKAFSFHIEK